jgi:predicted O-methyltransferase YrrM
MKSSHLGTFVRKAHSLTAIADFYINSRSDSVGDSPEEIIEFSYRHYPIRPRQVRSEVLRFARLVRSWTPKTLVEIGTHTGGMFFVLCRCAHPEATVISIDLPGARFSGGHPKFIEHLLPRMPLDTQRFCCLRADSHESDSLSWLETTLEKRQVDVMLIDGDHTYEGVRQDFAMYSPLVRKGGIVAFHDIVKHTQDPECEVDVFWKEIKVQYKHEELIEDPDQGWAGIGVLYL